MLPLLNNWTTSRLRSGVSCLRAPMTDLLDESCLSSKISVKSWLPQNIPSLSLCLEYRCGFLGQAENSICSKTLHFRESAEAKISSPTKESRDVSESLSLLRFVRLQACELPLGNRSFLCEVSYKKTRQSSCRMEVLVALPKLFRYSVLPAMMVAVTTQRLAHDVGRRDRI